MAGAATRAQRRVEKILIVKVDWKGMGIILLVL